MGERQLSEIPGDLREFVFDKFQKLKTFVIGLYDTQAFLIISLVIIGILIHFLLQYSIGLRLGNEQFKNKNRKKRLT